MAGLVRSKISPVPTDRDFRPDRGNTIAQAQPLPYIVMSGDSSVHSLLYPHRDSQCVPVYQPYIMLSNNTAFWNARHFLPWIVVLQTCTT